MNKNKRTSKTMLSNPAYIMPAVILGAVLIYFLYYAVDKVGLETQTATAVVTAKDFTPGSTNYVNRIAGNRSWVQAQKQPDYYAVSLTIDQEPAVALVTKEKFDRLAINDRVRVTYRHTRITGKIDVLELD
jgi:hypothetical protein